MPLEPREETEPARAHATADPVILLTLSGDQPAAPSWDDIDEVPDPQQQHLFLADLPIASSSVEFVMSQVGAAAPTASDDGEAPYPIAWDATELSEHDPRAHTPTLLGHTDIRNAQICLPLKDASGHLRTPYVANDSTDTAVASVLANIPPVNMPPPPARQRGPSAFAANVHSSNVPTLHAHPLSVVGAIASAAATTAAQTAASGGEGDDAVELFIATMPIGNMGVIPQSARSLVSRTQPATRGGSDSTCHSTQYLSYLAHACCYMHSGSITPVIPEEKAPARSKAAGQARGAPQVSAQAAWLARPGDREWDVRSRPTSCQRPGAGHAHEPFKCG